jgi:hypothetical protein
MVGLLDSGLGGLGTAGLGTCDGPSEGFGARSRWPGSVIQSGAGCLRFAKTTCGVEGSLRAVMVTAGGALPGRC